MVRENEKKSRVGDFILPIAAIRSEGTTNAYLPPEIPALPSFRLQKAVSATIVKRGFDYWTGTVYRFAAWDWKGDGAGESHAGMDGVSPIISVIIPTLNEEACLGATLDALAELRKPVEVIVVDGGSRDGTLALARARGIRALETAPGRGVQMNLGARAARGAVLWFLHADTIPPADAVEHILKALRHPGVVGGNFRLRLDGSGWAARFMTTLQPLFCWLGLVYGDSAIFVRRADYERTGGFKPFPLFEDLDLVQRLRQRGRMVRVPAAVVTSSRRFEGRSFTHTFSRWIGLQLLYWLGVSPHRLIRLYPPIRGK